MPRTKNVIPCNVAYALNITQREWEQFDWEIETVELRDGVHRALRRES
jgi:hypothetical protein